MFRTCLVLLAALAAGACTTPEKLPEDESPRNLTSVMELHTVNHGIKGLLPFESTSLVQTRSAMQRVDSRMNGTGTVTRFTVGGRDQSTIARLDRKLIWAIDHKEKTYSECPLKGCAVGGVAKAADPAAEPKGGDKPGGADCRMKIVRSALTVKRTGEKRSINGFDTDQFHVTWVVRLQDARKRQSESRLALDVWTARFTPTLKEAMAMEAAYDKAFAGAVAAGGKRAAVVPDEAARLIDAYLSPYLAPRERAAFIKTGKELDRIKGYPVLTELEWNMKGEACAPDKPAEEKAQAPSEEADLLSSVKDFFTRKNAGQAEAGMEDKPILAFTREVKSHQVQPVRDSVFLPPGGYQQAR